MNDILFGNNNSEVITKLSKRYFKKNKVRNLAALLAIILTAFLFTSITSLAFNMASSIQLSLQMQKGSKADGTLGYMTEEQYEQLVNSDFVEQAGHRRIIGYASNTSSHSIEINYADSVQQELTFCVPTHGAAPEKANEIATTDLALKALGVEPKIGAAVPLEFELRGKTYHYDMPGKRPARPTTPAGRAKRRSLRPVPAAERRAGKRRTTAARLPASAAPRHAAAPKRSAPGTGPS